MPDALMAVPVTLRGFCPSTFALYADVQRRCIEK